MTDNKFFTQVVHAGEDAPPPAGAPIAPSIYPAVSYTYDDMHDLSSALHDNAGYSYMRYGSPTISALEAAMAALEGAEDAVAYSTGMAALHAAFAQANLTRDRPIVAAQDTYGATYSLLKKMYDADTLHFVDMSDPDAVKAAIDRFTPRVVFLEAMSNPLLKIADLPQIAQWAHDAQAIVIVDATFATPYLIQPLKLGADVVIHSATKYLGGHGDVMGGVIATDAARAQELRLQIRLYGSNLGPFEAWIVLRGLRTLALRMRAQCANALRVAQWLSHQPTISKVLYPGLPHHPHHTLAKRLFRAGDFGGVVSFELRDAAEPQVPPKDGDYFIFRFMEALKLIRTGTSLGDVYSLLLYPAQSSHHALGAEERHRRGIGDGLVRLSVGIEDADDIIADLQHALNVMRDA
jgi:cystathionine gamma-synthase/methionine-gamma-lyase